MDATTTPHRYEPQLTEAEIEAAPLHRRAGLTGGRRGARRRPGRGEPVTLVERRSDLTYWTARLRTEPERPA
ncbi:hypothetical protein O7606_17105 [Micromonospora sp. WMMD882]|uniref:hypothetical protein n=1 Tax=Micromonospora sp. WMMD882 TaxID=3015151 RepID=UPI00248B6F69|nr:hypothetical protein [Micromonospora sp. WMMD882]WBB77970.1 hypothetical protein O7606_17105 [Micromonospora sp. WMMD882]